MWSDSVLSRPCVHAIAFEEGVLAEKQDPRGGMYRSGSGRFGGRDRTLVELTDGDCQPAIAFYASVPSPGRM